MPADTGALARNNFDALRLGLALLVVWSHSFALWYGSEAREPISRALGGVYNAGNLGVLGFFTISGFLILLSWLRSQGALAYLGRRVRRIYPGYLVATALCSLVIVPAFSSLPFLRLQPGEGLGLASNLLLRNYILPSDAFGGGPVNGALWSIPYEFWCYLGILALGAAGLARARPLFPAAALGAMLVRVWLDLNNRHTGGGGTIGALVSAVIGFPYFWFVVLPSFLLGASAFHYRKRLPRNAALLAGLIALLVLSAHLPLADPLRSVVTRTLLPPTLAYAIFFLAFAPGLRAHGAARYGDFSYGCYLYAFPIQQMLAWTLRGRIAFPTYLALNLACSLAAGVASWYLVERWFLRRTVRRDERRVLGEEAAIVAP